MSVHVICITPKHVYYSHKDTGVQFRNIFVSKFKYAKITSAENGAVKKGIIFATYSSLIGESQSNSKYRTRMKMLLNWCGPDFDGVVRPLSNSNPALLSD